MNQQKIGAFIAKLRKEKGLTQEQLAERLGVSNKSISRWENGNSMPDLSLLQYLCKEFEITISELLQGERIQKEHIPSAAENTRNLDMLISFSIDEQKRRIKKSNFLFFAGFLCLILLILDYQFAIFSFVIEHPSQLLLRGILISLGMIAAFMGIYANHHVYQFNKKEIDIISTNQTYIQMKTAQEMLQFARKCQKADFIQYKRAFQKIEENLFAEEYVWFSMVAESYTADGYDTPWHIGIAVTEKRLLLSGEFVRGRLSSTYVLDEFALQQIKSIRMKGKTLEIHIPHNIIKIQGPNLENFAEPLNKLIFNTTGNIEKEVL